MAVRAYFPKRPLVALLLISLLFTSACQYFRPRPKVKPPVSAKETPLKIPRVKPIKKLDPAAQVKIESLCEKLVDESNAPGLVLLIGQGDRVLYSKAFGHRVSDPQAEPMTIDTLFDLASVTKPTCTAAAILLLAQDGRVALDSPVARYVPEFNTPDKQDITIAHLLTHTSGLQAYTAADKLMLENGPRPNPDALIRHIASLEKKYAAGEGSIYSCLNYLVLGRVVKNATSQTLDAFLRERLWTPLGMTDTTFHPTPQQLARVAPTIHDGPYTRRGEVHDPLAYYSICADYTPGNAGCFSTADDLSKWIRLILNGGKWNDAQIFKPVVLETMLSDQTTSHAFHRTFGWEIASGPAYATPLNRTPATTCLLHTGYTGTMLWMDRLTNTYVIFLSNSIYPDDSKARKQAVIEARREIIRTLLESLAVYKL